MVARDHRAYESLGDMPFHFEKKLKRLEDICNLNGPMSVHKSKFVKLIGELRLQEENRHFIAHALMNVNSDEHGKNVIKLSMYDHRNSDLGKGIVHAGQWRVDFDNRDEYTELIESLCSRFMQLATEAFETMKKDVSSILTPNQEPPLV
jgi:hypothetical protein